MFGSFRFCQQGLALAQLAFISQLNLFDDRAA